MGDCRGEAVEEGYGEEGGVRGQDEECGLRGDGVNSMVSLKVESAKANGHGMFDISAVDQQWHANWRNGVTLCECEV
ncbi:hypothetical protein Pmani_009917 [Petrolisthes manimaculis]|uniref:Uncharacterized protein n=1 Tax=Petrolisthes manimaculis TaxID=1843537 RepID=A0AAE1UHV0_9EUCA|nr:hypothetical protein Pmani_009917 [Petrolisthes manimaculis]